MADRSKLATERMTVSVIRAEPRAALQPIMFCALEGPLLVLIEADSEDEAHAICAEQGLEFVCLCDAD
jgi:hypothetical protein